KVPQPRAMRSLARLPVPDRADFTARSARALTHRPAGCRRDEAAPISSSGQVQGPGCGRR
ncbi:MAG: hypothetical protein P4L30_06280, partial [Candidatus Limnocylindrales bacterium]|nr:hypothetical protein [Candidatus Limnocylindrales bacterium]